MVEFMQQFDVLVVAEPVLAVPKIPLGGLFTPAADGGTVAGSADGCLFFFFAAVCRAEH